MKPMTAEWIAKFAVAFRYPGNPQRPSPRPMHSVAVIDFVMWPVKRSGRRCRLVKDKCNG